MNFVQKLIMDLGWKIRKFGEKIHDWGLKIYLDRKYGKELI